MGRLRQGGERGVGDGMGEEEAWEIEGGRERGDVPAHPPCPPAALPSQQGLRMVWRILFRKRKSTRAHTRPEVRSVGEEEKGVGEEQMGGERG